MSQVHSDAPEPGQEQSIRTIRLVDALCDQGNSVRVRWVPECRGVSNFIGMAQARGSKTYPQEGDG